MNIGIKIKPKEMEAIMELNEVTPCIYSSKYHSCYWAICNAERVKEDIDWVKLARSKVIEKNFSGNDFTSCTGKVVHIPVEENAYENLRSYLTELFNLKRPIQKAYLLRLVLAYTVKLLLDPEKKDYSAITDEKKDNLNDSEAYKLFRLATDVTQMLFENLPEDHETIESILKLMDERRKR